MLTEGDSGYAVARVQKALNGYIDKFATHLEPVTVDKVYGPQTKAAVAIYQKGDGLPATGNVDGVTMALLMEYVPDWIDNHTGGGVGPQGPQGPAGEQGTPGVDAPVPTGVTLTYD